MAQKFTLTMHVKVHNLEQLRRSFDADSTLAYFRDGTLVEWLRALELNREASEIAALDRNDPNALNKIRTTLGIEDSSDNAIEATTTISNLTGLHAQTAAKFSQKAQSFASKIKLKANGKVGDAKNVLELLSMGIIYGTEVTVSADGDDAAQAVKELKALIDAQFGEETYD